MYVFFVFFALRTNCLETLVAFLLFTLELLNMRVRILECFEISIGGRFCYKVSQKPKFR